MSNINLEMLNGLRVELDFSKESEPVPIEDEGRQCLVILAPPDTYGYFWLIAYHDSDLSLIDPHFPSEQGWYKFDDFGEPVMVQGVLWWCRLPWLNGKDISNFLTENQRKNPEKARENLVQK